MTQQYKEFIVKRPKFSFGESREYFYSENPDSPKYRLLLTTEDINSGFEFHNACIEFQLAFGYHELSDIQKMLKAAVSFHGFTCNSGVGEGLRLLQEEGFIPQRLLELLTKMGADKQCEILARYELSVDSQINCEYYGCKPDLIELSITFVRENIDEFVKIK